MNINDYLENGKLVVKYWKYPHNFGNFGDEICPFLVKEITKHDIINWKHTENFKQKKPFKSLVGVGSFMEQVVDGDLIWGTGIRLLKPSFPKKNLHIYAVRGPKTRDIMIKSGYSVPEIYGDPALLMPKYYKPVLIPSLTDKVGLVPHYSNYQNYKKLNLPSNIQLIDPTDHFKKVIDSVSSCKMVISNSLHGIIVADAYNIPNKFIYQFDIDEKKFKFEDYYASQNREFKFETNLGNALKTGSLDHGNKIDLNLLLKAFPSFLIKK